MGINYTSNAPLRSTELMLNLYDRIRKHKHSKSRSYIGEEPILYHKVYYKDCNAEFVEQIKGSVFSTIATDLFIMGFGLYFEYCVLCVSFANDYSREELGLYFLPAMESREHE